ncbi:hypothetical protein CBR_g34987 [Chara braunii]|uniref:Uncharacterized protein n=1 Tax=Chara braunii TaxID=69332 RepID=A0A388LK18_CHABU|nr:hypothetical protein CBR_g34987 [Chara braunii]|eukprot:GBG82617.1 hypothetical protein CBR_g34987 [Chara braunii]
MGRYQQELVGLCEGVKEWKSNIPTVFLYDSRPKSVPGQPGVNVVGSCPQPGMRERPLTPQTRLAQAARTRNQAKASTRQEPPRGEHEPGRRKDAVKVEDDDDEEEEDERLRREEDQRAEKRARKKGTRGEAEPVIHDGPPKKKKYAVRLEEGFDVEKVIDRLLEGHNDLITLKEILASAPRLRAELKGRLSRRLLPNVHLGTILPKEAEWEESGTKMDWKCVARGTVDLMVKGSKCAAMVDTRAEMNIIREADAIRFGLDIDRSDCGIMHGASCKPMFCGTASNVLVEVGKVKAKACFFVMLDVDHGILLGRSFLSRTETVMFNKHDGTLILLLCDPACENYEIITCRNTELRSIRNRPNPGSFTIEESEGERRRLWAEPEAGERVKVFSLSLSDVGKAMDLVAAQEMADPDAIQALREQVLECPEVGRLELVYRLPGSRGNPTSAQTQSERTLMVELMKRKHRAYAFSDEERGRLDVDKIPMIRIHTVPHEPWNMREARYPNPDEERKVVDYLDGKIRTHVADYSSGPYASPWFCFIKPNGTLRWVQDLQRLNAVTVRDAGGLPNADALSESCAGRPIISLIDLYSGYDQFPIYPPDRPVTAMHTPRGLVHMNEGPQGWTNAVAMVQRTMIRAMQSVSPHITQPYIDDLAVQRPAMKESDEVSPENGYLVKNRADGLSRINWDKQKGEAVENTRPVDEFLDQEENVRLHINKWSPRVPNCVGYPIWQALNGYERRTELVLKPFKEEDPWGGKDVQWMMELALASSHSLVEDMRTIEEGPGQVERHEDLMGGMYLLVNTLLHESLDQSGSLNPAGNVDEIPESQDDEFEEGEIKEVFRAEEYDGIYLELGLLLSCEMRAQRMLQRYLVRDGHLFVRTEVGNPRRVVCGRNCQIDVVAALHDGIAGGHRGVQATYAKISELYYWDGMMDMVEKFCRSCVPCQERSRLRQRESLHPRLEREVGAVVHLDLLFMPLGDQGYNYIFDARDNLSGFVDGRAIRTKTGSVLVSCIEEYYLRYPFVREFVMDRGSEFTCQEVQELLSRSDFTKTAMPRGGKGTRPPQRPLGASGGYERHGPCHQESTPVYNDGDIELFLDSFWEHTRPHALEHPDLEEPAPAEPRQESCQPENEMEAEIPKRVDLRTRERVPVGKTVEEKRARRTRRIDEIWQERQRLEAAGELPEQQQERQRSEAAGALPGQRPSAPARAPEIPEIWRDLWEQRGEELPSQSEPGLGWPGRRKKAIIESLRQQTQGKVDRPESSQHGEQRQPGQGLPGQPSATEPCQQPPMGRVILESEEVRAERQTEREAFEFRAPIELVTLPVAAAGPVVPLAVEKGLPPSSSKPAQGSVEESMGVLLEAVPTMQEEVSLFSPEQRIEEPLEREMRIEEEGAIEGRLQRIGTPEYGPEEIEEQPTAVPEVTLERRPQRLDTPDYVPATEDLRGRLGSWATRSGSGGPVPRTEQQKVISTTPPRSEQQGGFGTLVGSPSSPPPQPRKKKFKRKVDQLCFYCKRDVHLTLDCLEFLEDKATGKISEVGGKMYDRQGRIAEKSANGIRAQLYRQNQEELRR